MIGTRPAGYRKGWRPCTCDPDERPAVCPRRYALTDCLAEHNRREDVVALLATHVRRINRVIASGMHERAALYEAADEILAVARERSDTGRRDRSNVTDPGNASHPPEKDRE
jgi:hypothetical protein